MRLELLDSVIEGALEKNGSVGSGCRENRSQNFGIEQRKEERHRWSNERMTCKIGRGESVPITVRKGRKLET